MFQYITFHHNYFKYMIYQKIKHKKQWKKVDLCKNDVHCFGIVFLKIAIPEIFIKNLNVEIKSQSRNQGCKTL